MININRLTIADLARELQNVIKADPFKAVYWKGKMISPTLPDSRMIYG